MRVYELEQVMDFERKEYVLFYDGGILILETSQGDYLEELSKIRHRVIHSMEIDKNFGGLEVYLRGE